MTESSVSSAFMKKLRERLPNGEVFKHNDLGLKGLPDCSVTWSKLTLWLEFKLEDGPRYTTDILANLIQVRINKAPVQFRTCRRLAESGFCLYMVWFRSLTTIAFFDPLGEQIVGEAHSTSEATSWVENWFLSHRP